MIESCWFCKKNPELPSKAIDVPILKVIKRERLLPSTKEVLQNPNININKILADSAKKERVTYHSMELHVPRCSVCAEAHAKVRKVNIGCVAFAIVTVLAGCVALGLSQNNSDIGIALCGAFPFSGVIVLVVGIMANKRYLRSLGTLPESDHKKYSELLRLLGEGYTIITKKQLDATEHLSAIQNASNKK